MLQLTRLGGHSFALNPDLIERADATPDTVVTLVNGTKYIVMESLAELAVLLRSHRAEVIASAQEMIAQGTFADQVDLSAHVMRRALPEPTDLSVVRPAASVVPLHRREQ